MSYGLTPYDKESYRQSKRRQRQAEIAEETGRIIPVSSKGRIKLTVIFSAIALGALAILGTVFLILQVKPEEKPAAQTQELEESEALLNVVNKQNPLEKDFVPELENFGEYQVSALMSNSLSEFVDDARKSGIEIKLSCAYISYSEQEKLYEAELERLISSGNYTEVRAQAQAQKSVAQAGCSEAQTGLLVGFDISDGRAKAYIERNCVNYGFTLRYPQDKEGVTKMNGNASLYRYVGKNSAIKMRAYNMCLEEYAEYISIQKNNK